MYIFFKCSTSELTILTLLQMHEVELVSDEEEEEYCLRILHKILIKALAMLKKKDRESLKSRSPRGFTTVRY